LSTGRVLMARAFLFAAVSGVVAPAAHSQSQQDSGAVRLDSVIVTVTRTTGRSVLRSPFAVSIVQPDSTRPGQRHAGVDETLALIPGLSATNRNNPSQDPRLSIRGFGARSTFGVRGVRVLRDGMPLTLPDGQTPLDYLSLESVGRVEVMRGAASALYGNASGGVIDIRTVAPSSSALSADARQWIGPDQSSRSVFAASGASGSAFYVADAAHTRTSGERDHSRQRATSGFLRAGFTVGKTDYSVTGLALDNPLSENPGALTIEEMRANSSTADALSVRRNARKAVKQAQVGASAVRELGSGDVTISAFEGARSLDNPLTFAIVEIGRHTYGASGAIRQSPTVAGLKHRFVAGIDFQKQNDLRRNYATCADTIPQTVPSATCPDISSERGVVTLDQRELVSSIGGYVSDEADLGAAVTVSAGVRADRIVFDVRDRLVTNSNPDDSGRRPLGAISPIAGIVVRLAPTHSVYANFSAAFETPTATELGNHEDGSAGINPDLDPQRSRTFEIGAKGFPGSAFRYDAAIFHTRVTDELVPFEIPGSNGRRFFRNAGRTARRGAELGAEVATHAVSFTSAYTYSRFSFDEYVVGTTSFNGNQIPGVPRHRIQSAAALKGRRVFGVLENETAGRVFVDDANVSTASGYSVTGVRVGFAPFDGARRLSFVVGVQNLFDRTYASSLAVNAARAKYYEPAPRRTVFAQLSLGAHTKR
jgi:iron complex outermembrane recepter protein